MSDAQVADVANYVRTHFGNAYPDAISSTDVAAARRWAWWGKALDAVLHLRDDFLDLAYEMLLDPFQHETVRCQQTQFQFRLDRL